MREENDLQLTSAGTGRRCLFAAAAFLALRLSPLSASSSAPAAPTNSGFAPDRMDPVLYGAAYYWEYQPYERLDKDVELMRQAGLNVVRLGESSWGLWEPQDGRFEFAWMDRVVERMRKAGIRVIMGTPTYSVPAWLYHEHPEIAIKGLDGRTITFGPRQNVDLLNPAYRFYCERVIRKIAEHYRDNPAVIGYQVDNETAARGAANDDVQAGFVQHLQRKFGSVDEMNRAWGLNYWGQRLNDWTEIPPEAGIINPGWKLEWQRYWQWMTTDFLSWQAGIVNKYKRPDQFVTQDLADPPRAEVNELEISRSMDIMAENQYHPTQDRYDGLGSSMAGDYTRSLKRTNYLVTETNAQSIGWDSTRQFPPYDGQLRLDVYTHLASGANMVEYWHWSSLHYGQETYWKGVLAHDLEPDRAYAEVSRTAHELQRVGARIVDLKRHNPVAVLYSSDSSHGIDFMKFSDRVDYKWMLHQVYAALYRENVGIDFVFPDQADLAQYKVIVAPLLYVASDQLLGRLVEYVRSGGRLLLTCKSGFANEYDTVRWTMAPGPLRPAAGFRYQEFSSLEHPLALRGDPFQAGAENRVTDWAELLILEGAQPLAYYDHPFFGKFPAVTMNRFGQGSLTYEGTVLSDALQQKIVQTVLKDAGLAGQDQTLPAPVRVKHGTNRDGKLVHYYLNYSGDPQSFAYPYGGGEELLTKAAVNPLQEMALKPWGVAIVEER